MATEPRRVAGAGYLRSALRRIGALIQTDAEVREARASAEDLAWIGAGRRFSIELVAAACERFAARPCFGSRDHAAEPSHFTTITYRELWERVRTLASGLREMGNIQPGELVGIAGSGSVDWVVADLACSYLGAVSVPLQSTSSDDDLEHIVREAELICIVADAESIEPLRPLLVSCPSVRSLFSIADVEARGHAVSPVAYVLPSGQGDPLFSVVYTSGSTGRPKGVMISESRWARTLRDTLEMTPMPAITVGYLPLSHMAGRINVYTTMMAGGTTHFVAKSDLSTLFEDIRLARPTTLTLVPRVSGMIYQHFQSELVKRGGEPRAAAEMLDDPRAGPIMAEMRESFLGGRLCFVTTGAAPTAPEVVAFLERCFEVHIVDTYGSTEFGRVTVNGRVQPWVSYKLVDVPELGYTKADQPYPRGELAVKSTREAAGYFKNAEASAKLRDADGYLLSGDIVEERAPGHIVWLDRKHSVLRLAHGEFVNVSKLEDVFPTGSPFIEQIYVYGNPLRAYLLAVIVPNLEAFSADLRADPAGMKKALRRELERVASDQKLSSHERPRDFIVEHRPFTKENDLLTEANKPKRPRLKAEYGKRLEELYATIEARQLRALDTSGAEGTTSIPERVHAAIALTLGLSELDTGAADTTFKELGGDSLGAVRLSALLLEACGVSLPVGDLLDPSATIAMIVSKVARELERVDVRELTFERVHGKDAEWARAKDLRVEQLFSNDVLERERRLSPFDKPQVVLLTGATGFLGRFLALDLLEAAAERDGEVVCVVRAPDDDSARRRLRACYAQSDPTGELVARFDALGASASRLRVHAGDFTRPRLGLAESVHRELADRVDAVLHNGALVNHALAYPHLFDANVGGTAEIVRFVLDGRSKLVHFVSTGGVAAGIRRTTPILETEGAAQLWSRRPVRRDHSDYALGYATSKWACETLLSSLAERAGVPVIISRCGMILPHTRYPGAVNEEDAFARLLFGLVRTGVAPTSFYDEDYRGERHYDGLPVDLVARFIALTTMDGRTRAGTYHVSNSSWDDGVSLDTVVDVIEGAGYPLARLPYASWYPELRARLEALPAVEKARSPLAIVHRWEHPAKDGSGLLKLDTTRFRKALNELTSERIPSLSEAYIRQCLRAICGEPRAT